MQAELIQDKDDPQSYRVEAIDEDGGCQVAIFSGPDALERAIAFAGGGYYDGWNDPQGLSPEPDKQTPEEAMNAGQQERTRKLEAVLKAAAELLERSLGSDEGDYAGLDGQTFRSYIGVQTRGALRWAPFGSLSK